MSGHHHQRTGWTYGPRPHGICSGCLEDRVVDTNGLMVTHRLRRDRKLTGELCHGSRRPPLTQEPLMPIDEPPDTPDPAGMPSVLHAAGMLANEFATFRHAARSTLRALTTLHTAMRTAGLLPEDDTGAPAPSAAIMPLTDFITDTERTKLTDALGIPAGSLDTYGVAYNTTPLTDTELPPQPVPDYRPAPALKSCSTCWPKPCDPDRSMCRRHHPPTDTTPGLCDSCGHTDKPVTATDDGRALMCAACLPHANNPETP